MTKTKSTKRALLMSALSLVLCVSMLVGSTFAWFTDSVTSAGNKIQAGTLKLDLELLKDGQWTSIKESREPLFSNTLWEPGYTEYKVLKVENEGTLALKWVAKFTSQKALSKLAEVIDVYVYPSETELAAPADRDLTGYTKVGTLATFINTIEQTTYGNLSAGEAAYLGIALKMQESAGNEYQGLDLGGEFDITIFATQYTEEKDSFDDQYDVNAEYDDLMTQSVVFPDGVSAVEVVIENKSGYNVASVLVPKAAVPEGETEVKVVITKDTASKNIVVAADQEVAAFDVTVLGLKEGNTEPVTVELRIPAGLDPNTVKLYHYDEEIDCSYNPNTGYVTFESATFSPFAVVYDAESEYVAPEVEGAEKPKAIVVESKEYENVDLPWGSYGQWSPTEGLDSKLEAAFTFSCPEGAEESPYANWYCDFYVKLDKDLGKNEIFLGGNYGSFGWIGFHNGDLTLAANTEIGLLESVTTNPWTYYDVASYVGTFLCGVGDVNDALEGATFTVSLRLTNPETNETIDANVVEYTFGGSVKIDGATVVNSADELQDAFNNGDGSFILGGDINLG